MAELLEDRLPQEDLYEVLLSDVILRGQPYRRPDLTEIWVVVEVSSVVDRSDIFRARRRAEILRQAGYQAIPAVAGEVLTDGAKDEALRSKVFVLLDGLSLFWNEALTNLKASTSE